MKIKIRFIGGTGAGITEHCVQRSSTVYTGLSCLSALCCVLRLLSESFIVLRLFSWKWFTEKYKITYMYTSTGWSQHSRYMCVLLVMYVLRVRNVYYSDITLNFLGLGCLFTRVLSRELTNRCRARFSWYIRLNNFQRKWNWSKDYRIHLNLVM